MINGKLWEVLWLILLKLNINLKSNKIKLLFLDDLIKMG